jgi:streptomycin 3"-adenylyltransferase
VTIALANRERLPPATVPVLETHVGALAGVLGSNLVGVYVHGSAALGGFNPAKSDLDYVAVVENALTADERRALAAVLLPLHGTSGFAKGVEMSIVEGRFAGHDFRHPTPYEFHMGTPEQVRLHGLAHDSEHCDPDLASHFAVIQARGICVYGRAIGEVFAPVDHALFLTSNLADIASYRETIKHDPVYAILNLCRTLCGLRKGAVLSKEEGAIRYLEGAAEFRTLVETALGDYRSSRVSAYDSDEAQRFVGSMLEAIATRIGKLATHEPSETREHSGGSRPRRGES